MDSGDEANEENRVRTDLEGDVERAESEQESDLLREEKKDQHSGLDSEVSADSKIDYELFTVQGSNKTLKELRDEKQESEGTESEALPVDGFRSMLLTAALNGRPESREGDRSRPVSANGADPEKPEQLYIESVKTQAFEKELDVVSIQSTAGSSSSTFIEKSETRLEEHGNNSESVLPFPELGAEQFVSEEETGKKLFTRNGLEQVEVVSQCSQTEWSWLQDWKLIQLKMGNKSDWAEHRSNSGRSLRSIEGKHKKNSIEKQLLSVPVLVK